MRGWTWKRMLLWLAVGVFLGVIGLAWWQTMLAIASVAFAVGVEETVLKVERRYGRN